MNSKVSIALKECIKGMRKWPTNNMVVIWSSNPHYDEVSYLDIFRRGPNSYVIKFNSAAEGCSWVHEDMPLRLVVGAMETWIENLKYIDKSGYFEY